MDYTVTASPPQGVELILTDTLYMVYKLSSPKIHLPREGSAAGLMVDSNARLVEPPAQGVGETGSAEQAVPFQFTVTWTSVFDPFETPKAAAAAVALINDRVRTMITAPTETLLQPPAGSLDRKTTGDEPVFKGQKSASDSSFQWEMVVPKMVRSAPKPARASEISAPSSRSRPVFHERPVSAPSSSSEGLRAQSHAIAPSTAAEQPIPKFCSLSPSFLSRVRQASLGTKLLLTAAALAGLAVPIWQHFGSTRQAAPQIQTATKTGGWVREPVTKLDAGFNHARELVVYRPSLKATDCRFEFNWRLDTPSVGWVFRAKDTANYYAMRIKLLKPGPSPTLSVEHFAVYRGTEGAHSEKVLVLSRNDPVLHIRMEIAGPSFTLYIGETAADYWTDTKLAVGGLGFFQEWHQGSDVEWVRMSFAAGTEIQRDGLRLYTYAPSGGD